MKKIYNFIKNLIRVFGVLVLGIPYFCYINFATNNTLLNVCDAISNQQNVTYAKAGKDCILYKEQSLSEGLSNIYFYIPETYFVTIISKASDNIYRVLYDKFTGYCKASDLTIVNFKPKTTTLLNITFDINQKAGTQIWSAPSDNVGTILSTISADTKSVEYIASVVGEIPIGGSSNIWYYARYTPASYSTAVYEGYVYSESAVNLTHIPNNLEANNELIAEPKTKSVNLNIWLKVVFIALICLPFIVLFVVSLVKAKKQFKKPKPVEEEHTSRALPSPKRKIAGSFIKKPKNQVKETSDDTIEVVFPEYNFVDDDDLL